MPSRALSLRARLAGLLGVLFLGGMAALYLAAGAYGRTAADRSFDRLLAGSVLSISETLSVDGLSVQVDIPYAALDMLSAAPEDRVFYRVFGPGAGTVTGYDDLPVPPAPRMLDGAAGQDAPRFFDASYRGETVRFAVLGREVAEPSVRGWIYVQVGQTRRAREALADELVLGALVPIALMTLLAMALVWFGITRALEPLQRIGHDLSMRTPADLQPVVEPVPVEIAPLIDAINVFMRRLGANIDTLRAFIGEAAHQMRTPLAALRAQVSVAMHEDDPAQQRRSLEAVERNAAKLSHLLNQMLSDATVIHRSDVRAFEAFDMIELVRQAVLEAVPITSDVDVDFDTELDEAPYVGDGLMIGEALKNLIDNAMRHGRGERAQVRIALRTEPRAYLLSVADRGPGIPPQDHQRVFERFARGDSSAPGAGLGLAIVRRAVESHGGRVLLADRDGGGLVVTLRLPNPAASVPA